MKFKLSEMLLTYMADIWDDYMELAILLELLQTE